MNCATRLILRVLLLAGLSWGCAVFSAPTLTIKSSKPGSIYQRGEPVTWSVELPAGATAASPYGYEVKKNGAVTIQSGVLDLAAGEADIVTRLDEPGMLLLEVVSRGPETACSLAGAAVAPKELTPCGERPADFDAFWSSKLKLLGAVPQNPVVTPGDSGNRGVAYESVQLDSINGAHVYGQLARPTREGRMPALLILQWAGGPYPLQKEWVTERAAQGWLAFNTEPHDVPGNLPAEFYAALPTLIKSYNTIYQDDRDRSYFLQMYLGAYRALEYLMSRPEWDGKTLVVTGTSMGGQQSLALAGLHPQITHLLVHVPAGADVCAASHGHLAGYPNWDCTKPEVAATAPYFDVVHFAPRIKARALVSMGFLDQICPPTGIWVVYNQIPGRKEVVPLPLAAHNHQSTPEQQQAYTDRANAWLAALVAGVEPSDGSGASDRLP